MIVPELEEKINFYGNPTKKLDKFDTVAVFFETDNKKLLLEETLLDLILLSFKESLEKTIQNQLSIPKEITPGLIGLHSNDIEKVISNPNFRGKTDDPYIDLGLFSDNSIETWLYNKNSKIILEISPHYKWHYHRRKKGEIITSYEEYRENYKPIKVIEISKEKAKKWLKKCKELCKQLNITSLYAVE